MNKSILSLVLIVIVGIGGFLYFSGGVSTDNTSSLIAQNRTLQSPDAEYIYTLSQQMGQVELDDSIFSSSFFQSLKDNTVSFPSQPSGRDNPFAPL